MARKVLNRGALDSLLAPEKPKVEGAIKNRDVLAQMLADEQERQERPQMLAPGDFTQPPSEMKMAQPPVFYGPHPLAGPVTQAVAAGAGVVGELGAGLANIAGKFAARPTSEPVEPIHFDRREFMRDLEKRGLIAEANGLDKLSRFVGEGLVNAGSIVYGGSALKAAGLSQRLANSVALGGTMAAHLQQGAANQGKQLPAALDTAVAVGTMAFGLGGTKLVTPYVHKAIEKYIGSMTKTIAGAVDNTTMSLMFSVPSMKGVEVGGKTLVEKDPDWGMRVAADALSFTIVGMHQAMFPDEAQPRTKRDAQNQMSLVEQGVEEMDILGRNPKKNPSPEFDAAVQRQRAETEFRNSQVTPDGKRAKDLDLPRAEELMQKYPGLTEKDAAKIAESRLDYVGRQEIIASRKNEELLRLVEESVGPEIKDEVAYRLDLMSPQEKGVYETFRKEQTPETERLVASALKLAEQAPSRERPVELGGPRVKETAPFEPRREPLPPRVSKLAEHGKTHAESPAPVVAPVKEIGEFQERPAKAKRAAGLAEFDRVTAPAPPVPGASPVAPQEKPTAPRRRPKPVKATPVAGEPVKVPGAEPVEAAPLKPGATADEKSAAQADVAERVRVVAQSDQVTNSEVVASVRPPEQVAARTERAVGAEAPAEATEKIAATAKRNGKLRPKLTDETGKLTYAGAAVATGAAAGAAGLAAALAEDEDAAAVAAAMAFPFLPFMRGGKRNPNETFADRVVKADGEAAARITAAVEKVVTPAEANIYRGLPGPNRTNVMVKDMMDGLSKIQGNIARRTSIKDWFAENDQIVQSTGHHLTNHFGKPGTLAGRLIQDMHRRAGMRAQTLEVEQSEIPTGRFGDKPHVSLHGAAKELLDRFMDWVIDPELPKPDLTQFRKYPGADRRAMVQLRTYLNRAPVDRADAQLIQEAVAKYDQFFSRFSVEAEQLNESFVPLHSIRGARYRPAPLRDEVFDPPQALKFFNPREYRKRLERSTELQASISRRKGMPITEVRQMLAYLKNKGYDKNRMLDEDLDSLINPKLSSHLDFSRLLHADTAIEWDPTQQLNRYAASTIRRLEFMRVGGPRGEVFQALLTAAGKLGYGVEAMKDLINLGTGNAPGLVNPRAIGRAIRDLQTLVAIPKLGAAPFTQLTQAFTPSLHADIRTTLEGWAPGLRTSIQQSTLIPKSIKSAVGGEDMARFLAKADVVGRSVFLEEIQGTHSPIARIATLRYKLGGLTAMDRFARNIGGAVGDELFIHTRRDLETARRRGNANEVKNAEAKLDEIFRDEPVLARDAKGVGFEPGQYDYLRYVAAESIGRRINLRTLPVDMPRLYSNPVGRLFYTIGTFAYRQTAEMHRLGATFRKGTREQRLRILYGMGFSTVGAATVYALRDLMFNRKNLTPEDDEAVDEFVVKYVIEAGFAGVYGPAYLDAFDRLSGKYGYTASQKAVGLTGPFFSTMYGLPTAAYEAAAAGKPDPMVDWMIRNMVSKPERYLVEMGREAVIPKEKPRRRRKKRKTRR